MLSVIRHGTGTCFWCSNETSDGAEIQVSAGKMFLCKKDFGHSSRIDATAAERRANQR